MKILVTGGTGYIGSHTVVELLGNGYEVRILDNLETSSEDTVKRIEEVSGKSVEFVKGDIRNLDDLRGVMDGVDGVIHFAAYKSVVDSSKDPLGYFENNVVGTRNIVSVMNEFGVRNIVFSSSAATYGNPSVMPITEDTPLDPLSVYGRNKLCMEMLLRDVQGIGINSVALRYFNAAGAHPSGKLGEKVGVIMNLIPRVFQASKGEYHLMVRGDKYETKDGTGVRDYVHVCDLADGHVRAMDWLVKQENTCEVFNLCSGEGSTVMEIIKGVEKVTGRDVDYEITDANPTEASKIYGSYEKANKVLGWKPTRFIDTILEDVNRWYKNNE
jgi:UDP-glucose 4-epimerase